MRFLSGEGFASWTVFAPCVAFTTGAGFCPWAVPPAVTERHSVRRCWPRSPLSSVKRFVRLLHLAPNSGRELQSCLVPSRETLQACCPWDFLLLSCQCLVAALVPHLHITSCCELQCTAGIDVVLSNRSFFRSLFLAAPHLRETARRIQSTSLRRHVAAYPELPSSRRLQTQTAGPC